MSSTRQERLRTSDAVFIAGGTFRMGSDRHYPEEAPVHRVTVGPFWMDRTPVTNWQFRQFVEATGYVTFAEIPPDPKDYPGASTCSQGNRSSTTTLWQFIAIPSPAWTSFPLVNTPSWSNSNTMVAWAEAVPPH